MDEKTGKFDSRVYLLHTDYCTTFGHLEMVKEHQQSARIKGVDVEKNCRRIATQKTKVVSKPNQIGKRKFLKMKNKYSVQHKIVSTTIWIEKISHKVQTATIPERTFQEKMKFYICECWSEGSEQNLISSSIAANERHLSKKLAQLPNQRTCIMSNVIFPAFARCRIAREEYKFICGRIKFVYIKIDE